MPRGRLLTDFERNRITELARAGVKIREIGRRLNRSHTVVMNYLADPAGYGKNHAGGKPEALTKRDKRIVLRLASNSTKSIRGIKTAAALKASRWTIWRVIKRSKHIVRAKLHVGPKLTQMHKDARLSWAEDRIQDRTDWTSVIFSDEKKFNLDGPDGYAYYWYDLRKEPRERYSRQQGGGSVMVWACLGIGGVRWCFVETTLNAESYFQNVLETHLVPYGEQLGGPAWTFQQDGASIHKAAANRQDFRRRIPRLLDWPSRSPDLNPAENLWGYIVRDVYAEGRQFDTVRDLRNAIEIAFNRLDMISVQDLVRSLPSRLVQVLQRNGGRARY